MNKLKVCQLNTVYKYTFIVYIFLFLQLQEFIISNLDSQTT